MDTYRFGFRHYFNPKSVIFGYIQYQDYESVVTDEEPGILTFDADTEVDGFGGELQYLYRSSQMNVTAGGGYVDLDGDDIINISFFGFPFPEDILPRDTEHTNIYTYSNITLPHNITLTVGGSGDFFETDSSDAEDTDQFNPKLGVTWNPTPDTTIRGAAFRVLKRTLVTDQTLEPTQVAGFNQFFDDVDATDAWRYGAAIDQKFSQNIFGGIEYSKRDLDVPYYDLVGDRSDEVDWDEDLGRAYLFWTPHEWFALSMQYIYEKHERDEQAAFNVKKLEGHKVPLGINFFHPSGISVSAVATYHDQEGDFEVTSGVFEPGDDDFWVVDAAIRYRLPKRYGFIEVGAKNLFDEKFSYFDTDDRNPTIQPERTIYCRTTISF